MSGENTQEATVPQWAANLGVAVAKIEERTHEIPAIVAEMKELRATMVPMQEYVRLATDVENLKERDLSARSDWEEIKINVLDPKGRLSVIWEERVQMRGGLSILGVVVTILTIWTLLHGLGVSISIK